jgi:hypothetical protein
VASRGIDPEPLEPVREGFLADGAHPLTSDQDRVLTDLFRFFRWIGQDQSTAHLPAKSPPRQLPSFVAIEPERRNQVFLLDGDRGSGKTTALLLALWALERSWDGKSAVKKLPEIARNLLQILNANARFVPLQIIDLRPFPAHRSLILDIPSVFLPVVSWLERTEKKRSTPDWDQLDHPARARWREFARVAALGYARPLERPVDDATGFVDDLADAGAKRLHIEETFSSLVDELVGRVQVRMKTQSLPVFVLPIDDCDMAPDRTLEVLDLIRHLRHRNLVYVLTGHTPLFHDILQMQARRWLTGSADPRPLGAELEARVASLGRDILRKHLPEAHRLVLGRVEPRDRVALAFPDPKLWLALRDHLGRNRALLARALPDRIRQLVALRGSPTLQPDRTERAFLVYNVIWRSAVDDAELPSSLKASLRETLSLSIRGPRLGSKRPWTLRVQPGRVHLRPALLAAHYAKGSVPLRVMSDMRLTAWASKPSVAYHPSNSARGQTHSSPDSPDLLPLYGGGAEEVELDERVTHAYALLVDRMGAMDEVDAVVLLANVRETSVAAIAHPYRSRFVRARWPSPPWRSLGEFLAFHDLWSRLGAGRDFTADTVARLYVALAVRTVAQSSFSGWLKSREPPSWTEIVSTIGRQDTNSVARRWASQNLYLLATPESGLENHSANELLDSLAGAGLLPSDAEMARVRRAHLLAGPSFAQPDEQEFIDSFCRDIDRRHADYLSASRFERGEIVGALTSLLAHLRAGNSSLDELLRKTATRQRELQEMPVDELHALRAAFEKSEIREFVGDTAIEAIRDAWRTVEGPDVWEPAGADARDDEVRPVSRLAFTGRHVARVPDGSVYNIASAHLEPLPADARISLKLLYRLLWDASVAAGDRAELPFAENRSEHWEEFGVFPWAGLSVRTPGMKRSASWPLPAFSRLYVWELWIEAWEQLPLIDFSSRGQKWVDGLAYAWAHSMYQMVVNNQMRFDLRPQITRKREIGTNAGSLLVGVVERASQGVPEGRTLMKWAHVAGHFFSDTTLSGVSPMFAEGVAKSIHNKFPTRDVVEGALSALRAR